MKIARFSQSLVCLSLLALPLSGCGGTPSATAPSVVGPSQATSNRLYSVVGASYLPASQTVKLYARPTNITYVKRTNPNVTGYENTIDLGDVNGVVNMATSRFSKNSVNRVQVYAAGVLDHPPLATLPVSAAAFGVNTTTNPMRSGLLGTNVSGAIGSIQLPPSGVRIDGSLRPLAGLSASISAKMAAVLQIAQSKLGTPYIWGHNEDRGQYGFDCSNFTAYVYHHALGYLMTGSSVAQSAHVGLPVAKSSVRMGDLLIFENGKHVGIYAGGGKMIEEGGGLGKVGYLNVAANSYWGKRITAVKRMF